MSYKADLSDESIEDLLKRKEFYQFRRTQEDNFRTGVDEYAGQYLKLHSHQLFIKNFISPNTPFKRCLLVHGTGCHSAETPILMHDAKVKMARDVAAGDALMGDDGTPRYVNYLIRGRQEMVTITPILTYNNTKYKSEPIECNIDHIVSLVNPAANEYIDISVSAILASTKYTEYLLYKRPLPPMIASHFIFNNLSPEIFGAKFCDTVWHISYDYLHAPQIIRQRLLATIISRRGSQDAFGVVTINLGDYNKHAPAEYTTGCPLYGYSGRPYTRVICDLLHLIRGLGRAAFYTSAGIVMLPAEVKPYYQYEIQQIPAQNYYGFNISGNNRYLLGCFTVTHNTGKSLAALGVAKEFQNMYRSIYNSMYIKMQGGRRNLGELERSTPNIYVLGFAGTRIAFIKELLRYPEFGFISVSEKDELLRRQKIAAAGLAEDIRQYKEYFSFLRKRITSKVKNGFFKFYGYQEFVNGLFTSDTIKLTDLETAAVSKARSGSDVSLESIIKEHIAKGDLKVNNQLLDSFKDSLLICDEIHNTYNSHMKNNYGVAIQYVLDAVPTLRALFMSGTPISNVPSEIVDVVNYLVEPADKIAKKDFFSDLRTLKSADKLAKLAALSRGRVSFLQDTNIRYFPKRVFMGESVTLPKDSSGTIGSYDIPYLKFIKCPMTQKHINTLNSIYNTNNTNNTSNTIDETAEEPDVIITSRNEKTPYSYHHIPTDGYVIYDLVYPNPEDENIGLYKSADIKTKIAAADNNWRDKHRIVIVPGNNFILSGAWLEKSNIDQYYPKGRALLNIIDEIFIRGDEKIIIYHERVRANGVMQLKELLLMNGIIDEASEPADNTRCAICGRRLDEHSKDSKHEFTAARFIIAHSEIEKAILEQNFIRFNAPDNARGHKIKILLGSKIIRESYDFKDIQNLIIMSLPVNIPTLIQVLGRGIRKNSHINLPPENRRVNVYMLLSTVGKDARDALDIVSPEEYRYYDKLQDYKTIQEIEREINKNAIDAVIHRDIIMPPELRDVYFPDKTLQRPLDILGNLYFEPSGMERVYTAAELNMTTFNAYKHFEEEINMLIVFIKRLFRENPVWTYDELWSKLKRPPFGSEINPNMFSEQNFAVALNHLVTPSPEIIDVVQHVSDIDRILDKNDKFIYLDGRRHMINNIGIYYILFPVLKIEQNPLSQEFTEWQSYAYSEKNPIKIHPSGQYSPIIDAESYMRRLPMKQGIEIDITTYMKKFYLQKASSAVREKFMREYNDRTNFSAMLVEYNDTFQMSIIEEAILAAAVGGLKKDALFGRILKFYSGFDVIIYSSEVAKYKDVAKQFKKLPADRPIGYVGDRSLRLYDAGTSTWIEVNKIAMNRQPMFKENAVIVGYFERDENSMRFKLRPPNTAAAKPSDTRLIERGIVCLTKNKGELLNIIKQLGISSERLEKSEIRIRNLCNVIRCKILELEMRERCKKSRIKYLYNWWDGKLN